MKLRKKIKIRLSRLGKHSRNLSTEPDLFYQECPNRLEWGKVILQLSLDLFVPKIIKKEMRRGAVLHHASYFEEVPSRFELLYTVLQTAT